MTPEHPSRYWLAVAAVVILGAGSIAGWRLWQNRMVQMQVAQEQAMRVIEIPSVTALARLEPQGELINLTAPTSAQESRIAEVLVQVGDRVEVGQVIAILDNRDRLQAALRSAQAQVRIAQAKLAQVKAGAKTSEFQGQRAEIARIEAEQVGNVAAQRATAARLAAEVENARVEAGRYDSLYQVGAISASQRDAKRLVYASAQRQLQEVQAQIKRIQTTSQQQLQRAEASLKQLSEVRPVDIQAAEVEVQSAIAAVREAQASLAQTMVRSPKAGQILRIHTQPGENIAEQGIAALGQTQQMMVVAEVYQGDIAKITLGQPVQLTATALPEVLVGSVERIGLEVQQQKVVNEDPAVNIDAKVIEVHIRLNPESSQKVAGLTNLQVTAKMQVQSES
ncbi:HlyD family efflux transporter periplasmic adaptor subunit [filamentous cyanobacterium LEGE 11480]|uniref:HlyD family efflux transporter periplasmic adaptor subunit n=2 Tax=Romeriopsis TaxID=2992131 RepID=A0A928Z413_9CYAN|nr:HlyD family efflux transporter periplasmic adaptor subunit [Romeriopsis navalis LEGE 11480]